MKRSAGVCELGTLLHTSSLLSLLSRTYNKSESRCRIVPMPSRRTTSKAAFKSQRMWPDSVFPTSWNIDTITITLADVLTIPNGSASAEDKARVHCATSPAGGAIRKGCTRDFSIPESFGSQPSHYLCILKLVLYRPDSGSMRQRAACP